MGLFQGFFVARWCMLGGPNAAPGSLCLKSEPDPAKERPPGCCDHAAAGGSVLGGSCDASLVNFCFPLGARTLDEWRKAPPKDFSFTLTGSMGDRLHGHCAVGWPDGNLTPQVVCFLSTHSYFDLFAQALRVASQLAQTTTEDSPEFLPDPHPLSLFLTSLLAACPPLPSPMASFRAQKVELALPGDVGNGQWNDGVHVASVLNVLSPSVVLDILSALLMERRCLFVASSLSLLSRTVHAVAALIYPFRWQHIFLPIVPGGLLDYLQAPMPWIAGLPRHLVPSLESMQLEETVVVNLDTGKIRMDDGARTAADALPWREVMFERLYKAMDALDSNSAAQIPDFDSPGRDAGVAVHPEMVANVLVASVMRDFFLSLLGSYRYFVDNVHGGGCTPPPSPGKGEALMRTTTLARKPADQNGRPLALQEGKLWFDHESFQRAHRSKRARALLAGMRGSQIYEVFIRERLALAAAGYQNSERDSFEADVAAVMVNGDFSTIRLSLRLQVVPAQIASQLKALHHEIKSSKRSSLKLAGSRKTPPSEGGGPLSRSTSVDSAASRLTDHGGILTPFSQKVGSASKSMGRAAAAVGSRVRKQANSLGGMVSNGLKSSTASRSQFELGGRSRSSIESSTRSTSSADSDPSGGDGSMTSSMDAGDALPHWGTTGPSLRTRRSTAGDDSECSEPSSPVHAAASAATDASTFDCPFSIQQLNARAADGAGVPTHSRNASCSSIASATGSLKDGMQARDGTLVGPSLSALFDEALGWPGDDGGATTPPRGGGCRGSPLSRHASSNQDLILSPNSEVQVSPLSGPMRQPAMLDPHDPFALLVAEGTLSTAPAQPPITGGQVSLGTVTAPLSCQTSTAADAPAGA